MRYVKYFVGFALAGMLAGIGCLLAWWAWQGRKEKI